MARFGFVWMAGAALAAAQGLARTTDNPFPEPIETERGLIVVDVAEFATLPDSAGEAPRMMLLVDEPITASLFVNDMRGPLYRVGYDGREVTLYLDLDDPGWGVAVDAGGRERGFQSFAFHPEFGRRGAPGYGRFYTWTDSSNTEAEADFRAEGGNGTHHTVLHEWRAEDADAPAYDGGPPRALIRLEQPFANHNAGHIAFNRFASPDDEEYGLLYIGSADGGSGGDPLDLAQDLRLAFGKILRIDPLGEDSTNGRYGIPASNPFVHEDGALGEIYAYGMRNPQRFDWDPATGRLFMADIGQNIVEWISLVTPGANLGWNRWEGSYRFLSRAEVSLEDPRGDENVSYPVVEYGRHDPLLGPRVAITGVPVYRSDAIPALTDRVLFADFPSGEIFHFDADDLPRGGTDGIRRVLLRADGATTTLLELIREKNSEQNRSAALRADLRFGLGPDDRIFLLNKHDGVIRELVPPR